MDGYKILDFKGVNIEDSETVEGIYKAIDDMVKGILAVVVKCQQVLPHLHMLQQYLQMTAVLLQFM